MRVAILRLWEAGASLQTLARLARRTAVEMDRRVQKAVRQRAHRRRIRRQGGTP